jgi:hypothetical protein
LGESTHALATVQRKLAENPATQEPGFRAELQDGLARLLAAENDYRPAYEAVRKAADLRAAQDFAPQFLPMAKMTRGNISAVTDSVSVDAAIRATQREAELALAKAHRQRLIIAVIAAVLLILLLTVAYQLKRRAATVAAPSREAAALRAENASSIGGTFAAINFTGFSSGISWNTSALASLGSITVSAVPEPSTFALLAGLFGLALAATRRRR